MKLEKEALIEKVKSYIGERTDDESISLLEDITDSIEIADGITEEECSARVKAVEDEWRAKYIARFDGKETVDEDNDIEKDAESITYDDIFED